MMKTAQQHIFIYVQQKGKMPEQLLAQAPSKTNLPHINRMKKRKHNKKHDKQTDASTSQTSL